MTYDNYGNIKTKNGVAYTYGNSSWKDLLTKVGNQTITYDAQGNPTSYLGHTFVWEKGRQLKAFDTNTYTYNANGIRTSKTVNGVTHTYTLDGTKILKEVWGNNTLVPLYDNEDSLCGIEYNGSAYWFFKNLQGDIISIANSDGDVIAKYTYDAWGACTVAEDTSEIGIATVNPYRYRGYYYDTEIGMYYLQSRYYDPTVGRFINADEIDNIIYNGSIIECNVIVYSMNSPIIFSDNSGENWFNDLWKSVKRGFSSAWNWIKNAGVSIGKFMKYTVWQTWIQKGVWQTFCKKWVWEKFCKEMVYNTFLKKWIWQTFCKKWVWQTFCKKWVWETFCKKWVWETFCKDWIANKTWNWIKSNWKKCVDWVANLIGGASGILSIISAAGLLSIPVIGQVALGIVGIACYIWTTVRLLGF